MAPDQDLPLQTALCFINESAMAKDMAIIEILRTTPRFRFMDRPCPHLILSDKGLAPAPLWFNCPTTVCRGYGPCSITGRHSPANTKPEFGGVLSPSTVRAAGF